MKLNLGFFKVDLLNHVESVMWDLGSRCIATTRFVFDSSYFTGILFDMKCHKPLEIEVVLRVILQLPAVEKLWPVRTLQHPAREPSNANDSGEARDSELGAVMLPRNVAPGAIRHTLSTHVETGVSRLHAANITGKGIRIAVLDTGFDLSTPGRSGTEIAYTRDVMVGIADVEDDCSYHGTHVLGIVGAKGPNDYGLSGVASDATYELYRVSNCSSGDAIDPVNVVRALLEVAERGVDIITVSMGDSGASPEGRLLIFPQLRSHSSAS